MPVHRQVFGNIVTNNDSVEVFLINIRCYFECAFDVLRETVMLPRRCPQTVFSPCNFSSMPKRKSEAEKNESRIVKNIGFVKSRSLVFFSFCNTSESSRLVWGKNVTLDIRAGQRHRLPTNRSARKITRSRGCNLICAFLPPRYRFEEYFSFSNSCSYETEACLRRGQRELTCD